MYLSSVSAIILSTGYSGRMGTDKAHLHYDKRLSVAEFLIKNYREFGCEKVIMVVNKKFEIPDSMKDNVTFVINHQVDLGRNHSIQLG